MIPAARPEPLPIPPLALEIYERHNDIVEDMTGFRWYDQRSALLANNRTRRTFQEGGYMGC